MVDLTSEQIYIYLYLFIYACHYETLQKKLEVSNEVFILKQIVFYG